jgi:aromatic-L-amino-acid/L-tryptophan decarboxylase
MSPSPPQLNVVIEPYKDEYQPFFAALNLAWIEQYFALEPLDRQVLGNPRTHIVAPGGEVFTLFENGTPKGTVAMLKIDERSFELIKMAVAPSAQGRGYGKRLVEHAVAFARSRGADRVLIRSNTRLRTAIALYRKCGFELTRLGRDEKFARGDIQLELDLRAAPRAAAPAREETLDPADWNDFRALAHRMVDDTVDYLASIRARPTWIAPSDAAREQLASAAPWKGQGAAAAYEEFLQFVRPYTTGNISPRFWGWVQGSGAPVGVLADFLASAMNPNAADFDHSPALVELQVLGWFRDIMGFPPESSGLMVSGGSAANLTALTVARNTQFAGTRERGVDHERGRLTVYASQEAHSSLRKAVEVLGLGEASLRLIRTTDQYTIDLDALRRTLAHDRAHGMRPFCIVGNAGTVNTGAIDPLDALADVCERERLWFHVDGAFGALGMLAPSLRPDLVGLERANSVIFDFHKWLYAPYEAACVLVRSGEAQRNAFSVTPAYLQQLAAGVANAPLRFSEYGVQLSRGFRALKIWLALKADGLEKYARLIEQNVAQAKYLAERVQATPELELLAPVPLNVVNFRYRRAHASEGELNELNQRILIELQESGFAVPSSTLLDGRFSIRCAIVNHRSTRADFDALAAEVVRLGRERS